MSIFGRSLNEHWLDRVKSLCANFAFDMLHEVRVVALGTVGLSFYISICWWRVRALCWNSCCMDFDIVELI